MLYLKRADTKEEFSWCQRTVTQFHYLHRPVDQRSSPLAYIVLLFGKRVGVLIFGRMESTRCFDPAWSYGSVEDVRAGRCQFTRWEILVLMRVWLDPAIQRGGDYFHPQTYPGPSILPGFWDRKSVWQSSAASYVVNQAVEQIGFDYLQARPPCFTDEPWQIRQVVSYCHRTIFLCTLYLVSGFKLVRKNRKGLSTYAQPLPELTEWQREKIIEASKQNARARQYRASRLVVQPSSLFPLNQPQTA